MPKGKGYEVVCPQCRESCHETTRHFKPNEEADGIMLQNKRQYTAAHDQAWDEPMKGGGSGVLICLMCGSALAPSGRLEVRKIDTDTPVSIVPAGPKLPPSPIEGKAELPPEMNPDISESAEEQSEPPNLASGEVVQKVQSDDKLPTLEVDGAGEIKAFICPHCGRDFKKKANLGSHMRVHKNK